MRQKRGIQKLAIKLTGLFLIVVLPLTLFSALVYRSNYLSLKQKTLESIEQSGEFITDNISRALQNVFYAHTMLNVDEKIVYMIAMNGRADEYQQYVNMRNVLDRLSSMTLSQSAVRETRLHIPSMNRTLISNGTATQLMDECKYYIENMHNLFMIRAGRNTLALACGYPWLAGEKYMYYLVTDIDCQELKQGILMNSTDRYASTYLYMDDGLSQPQLITCYGDAALFDSFMELGAEFSGVSSIAIGGERYLASMAEVDFFGLKALSLTPEAEVFGQMRMQSRLMLIALLTTVALILFFIRMIIRTINNPLRRLAEAFGKVQSGRLDTAIGIQSRDEFEYIYQRFNDMTSQMKRLIDENYKSRLLIQETRLRQLQAQVNPHFLYNSFRNIYAMAQMRDYEGIVEITDKLAAFYRYTAQNSGDTVRLCQEDEYACAYLGIQAMRFEERLEVRLQPIPEQLRLAPALHFSIQTIAENACKYALPTQPERCIIALSYELLPDGYAVSVDDNGAAMTDEKIDELNRIVGGGEVSSNGTGLINLHERLKLRWGDAAALTFGRSALGGLRVEMRVLWQKAGKGEA